MKKGEFAKKHNIPINTLRYYVDLGLIIPEKAGKHFNYNETCSNDLKKILEYKDLGLSLKQIHKLLSLKKITNSPYMYSKLLYELLQNKKNELVNESIMVQNLISNIDIKLNAVNNEIIQLEQSHPKEKMVGTPIDFIPYIFCPNCNIPLNFEHLNIEENQIISGKLFCKCSYKARFKDGILITPEESNTIEVAENWNSVDTLIKRLPSELVSFMNIGYQWLKNIFIELTDSEKVILSTGGFAGYFIKHIPKLNHNNLYIICAPSLGVIHNIKKQINSYNQNLKILYISSNINYNLPLKSNCIDLFLDDFSSFNHLFYQDVYIYDKFLKYLKNNIQILGLFFYFDVNSQTLKNVKKKYPYSSPLKLTLSPFKYYLKNNNYEIFSEEYFSRKEIFFDFYGKDESCYMLGYHLKKKV